ncbi:MAG: crotonase/enoyl-CoA hydratase family protein [Gammaproteobacteria bacterium]|nr:crotonase/enoyl-CoA hydratase family protein [Gammaproteobacteria bacterium]MYJ75754.1 crotonase/enoyl-CoA hydratase family protein [Gammaproteobacteria bacterium]
MSEITTYELIDHVAVIVMNDGKANAFGPNMIAAVNEQLDRAEAEAKAAVVAGRPGLFSGGFDLRVIRGDDPEASRDMTLGGARLMMRLYGHPQPLVIAATGHAVALGAFCLLTGDYRLGTDGDFRIQLNETAIGMSLPPFGLMLAKERLSKRYLSRATIAATMFSPAEATDAGFLDEVVGADAILETAQKRARAMVELDGVAYAAVKQSLRGPSISDVLEGLDAGLRTA